MTICMRIAVAYATVALVMAASPAAAQSSLTGETFAGTVTADTCPFFPPGQWVINFSASGTAAGSYPGTFTESGTYTIDTNGELTTGFNATFQIQTTDGTGIVVTGNKSGVVNPLLTSGVCFGPTFGAESVATVNYTATIHLPDGTTCTDSGTSKVNSNGVADRFLEDFTSSSAGPLTCTPVGGTNNKTAKEIAKTLAKCDKAGPDTDKCAKEVAKLEGKISAADFAMFTAMFTEMFGMPPP